jgi:starch synthase (maltosyl-transferring)
MRELIALVNGIRRNHRSLQQNATLAFHATDNAALLFYSKHAAGPAEAGPHMRDRVFVVASHDVHWMQQGWVQMPIWELGIDRQTPYVVEDLLDGARYTWRGDWNYVRLDPRERVAHILVVKP